MWFIKGFSKIAAPRTLILKTITTLVPARPACTKADKNELGISGGGSISSSMIDDKMVNLSSSIRKISFRVSFLILKASLAFIWLRKTFIEVLILHYFDLKHHIQMETNILSYAIGRMQR